MVPWTRRAVIPLALTARRMHAGVAGAARLAGGEAGPDWAYGRLEVARWGLWGNVCSMRGFTEASAAVSCTELGYGLGIPLSTEVRGAFEVV